MLWMEQSETFLLHYVWLVLSTSRQIRDNTQKMYVLKVGQNETPLFLSDRIRPNTVQELNTVNSMSLKMIDLLRDVPRETNMVDEKICILTMKTEVNNK